MASTGKIKNDIDKIKSNDLRLNRSPPLNKTKIPCVTNPGNFVCQQGHENEEEWQT